MGKILEPVKLSPTQVNFGRVSRKDIGQSKKIVITRGDASKLDLKLPERDTPGFKTGLRTVKPGEQYELEVTLIPPLPEKRILENLELETGFPEAPTASVRVYADVPPHVAAKPPFFSVPGNRDSDWEQSVRLEWDDEAPHKVLSATVEDPKLSVQVEEKNGTQLVVLHVPTDYLPRPSRTAVTIRTDDTKVPVLTVPVNAARIPRPGLRSGSSRPPIGSAKVIGKEPDTAKPIITKPNPAKIDAAKPEATKPDTTNPETPDPDSDGRGSQKTDDAKKPASSPDRP